MSSSAQAGWMRCEGCGRTAAWKPEFAGRRFRCKCGQIITAPKEPPIADWPAEEPAAAGGRASVLGAPAADVLSGREAVITPRHSASGHASDASVNGDDDAGYELADEARRPPLARRVPPRSAPPRLAGGVPIPGMTVAPAHAPHVDAPAIELPPPADLPPPDAARVAGAGGLSPTLAYRGMVRRREEDLEQDRQFASYQRWEMILPAALIAVGLVLTLFQARMVIGNWDPLAVVFFSILSTVINLALIFTALMITSKLLDLGLGELGPAVLKITAVAILPAAVGGIIDAWLRPHAGFYSAFVGWMAALFLYYFLLWLHFDMDFQEMAICTTIIWVIRNWVGMFVFMLLFKGLFGGSMTNPYYDADDADDSGDTTPYVVPDGGWTPPVPGDGMDEDDEDMDEPPVPRRRPVPRAPATSPATQPVP